MDIMKFLYFYSQCSPPTPRGPRVCMETHLTGHSVRAKLAEAQRGLDPPKQGHHIKVLDPTPDRHTHSSKRQHIIRRNQVIHRDQTCGFMKSDTPSHLQYRLLDTHLASGSYSDQILLNSSR